MAIRDFTESARIEKSVMVECRKIAQAEGRLLTRVLSDLIRAGLAQRKENSHGS